MMAGRIFQGLSSTRRRRNYFDSSMGLMAVMRSTNGHAGAGPAGIWKIARPSGIAGRRRKTELEGEGCIAGVIHRFRRQSLQTARIRRSRLFVFRRIGAGPLLMMMPGLCHQRLERDEAGGTAFLDAEFLEDVFEVFFHGAFGDAEDQCGLGIGLALGDPQEHFGFLL